MSKKRIGDAVYLLSPYRAEDEKYAQDLQSCWTFAQQTTLKQLARCNTACWM